MRILVWASTFGADLWSLTKYLDGRGDTSVKVIMDDPALYRREGVASLFPLDAEIVKRRLHSHLLGVPLFRPDVTIMDNWVPLRATSPRGFMLWHGFGWKGPNDVHEFRHLHASIRRAWGEARKPNPGFRWHTFGPWDFEHRTTVSGFHPSNCIQVGAASHDDLRTSVDRSLVNHLYPFDLFDRKTVLVAPTWHYGEIFAHWGSDAELLGRLLDRLSHRGVNVIMRLHDSYRFERKYVRFLEGLAEKHPRLLLKFKDRSPDNFIDLQVADVLVTNFSSIANLFYATRRPTVHVYPVASADEAFMWRRYTPLGVVKKKIDSVRFTWKLPPEDNGGLMARSFDELLEQVDRALDEPGCCRDRAESFLDKHMMGADGRSCERAWEAIVELVEGR